MEIVFSVAGGLAMLGWIGLIALPHIAMVRRLIVGLAIPALLGAAYLVLMIIWWPQAEGGFSSLASVALLFESPGLVLAGWLHYLAFDLFIGAWQVRRARAIGLPHLLVVPCLILTFLAGPIGLLAFLALAAMRRAHPIEA